MVRPRPVPPYLRVVEVSSWAKASKICACFSGADQVEHDLAQAAGIADHVRWQLGRHVADQFQSLLPGTQGQGLEGFSHSAADVESDFLDRQLAGFDLGEIEDVVEDCQQCYGG
jgi:hypothetical protein